MAHNQTLYLSNVNAKFRPPRFKTQVVVRSHRNGLDRHMFGVFLYLVRVFLYQKLDEQ